MTTLLPATGLPRLARLGPYVALSLVLLVAGLLAIPWDCQISQFVLSHPLRGDVRRLVLLSECFGYGLSVGLIIVTAAVLDQRGWRVGWRLLATAFSAGLASNVVKMTIARARPSVADLSLSSTGTFRGWLPAIYRPDEWGYALQSFPSSHTATAVGLAMGLAAVYPRGRWLFAGFAALTGLQRLTSGAHFLSDICCGAALACFVAGLVVTSRTFPLSTPCPSQG